MPQHIGRALLAGAVVIGLTTSVAVAQTVTFNGAPLDLNPPPQTRAGRVFVPLRGVFERLGASVVYDNGTINAQRNGRAVSLHIGSTQATVDGQPQTLDVAPFIIGASTYVPLRFISQALGATVNYDSSNDLVALSMVDHDRPQNMPPQNNMPPPPNMPPPQQRSELALRAVRPERDASVESQRPTIEAQFGGAQADPNSVRVDLDGLNVTDQSSRSPGGIVFSPPSDLQSGRHTVRVSGVDAQGLPFAYSWQFASGTSAVSNEIRDLRPASGSQVGDHFMVSGRTLPGARVVVQVGTSSAPHGVLGEIFNVGNSPNSSARSEVIADGNGMFSTPIDLDARPGQQLTLVVDSTDARTQASAPRVVRDLTVQ